MDILNSTVTDLQKVKFFFDDSEDLSGLKDLKTSQFKKIFIICDESLKNNWLKKIKKHISKKNTYYFFLPGNEEIKSLNKAECLINFFESKKCSKSDLIISIGGGTILDLSAFVASIYMRGINLMMVPTTLMGQADACSGGKTCINSSQSKNLIGTLYMPKYVYNNINIIETSSEFSLRQGISEIFKYGLLGSPKLLKMLKEYSIDFDKKKLIPILKETIKVRIKLRKKNPLISNLGHTFGHAFESESKNKVAHGDAIAVGIAISLKLSLEKKIISKKLYLEIFKLMKDLNLNLKIDKSVKVEALIRHMLKDKKSNGKQIGFVLLKKIGETKKSKNSDFFYIEPIRVKKFLLKVFKHDDLLYKNHWKNLTVNKL
ncbi:MAG: iron-containing alcohol dehydrogenase [Rickettsiales bacterium TMED289]|nr:MAG: iron-containing alcohol dehydrogenase [Rickettsiales bacterium TMED289]|tara:strand:+ start:2062 stop:3183 length:1122 start_codon:yes stop_codon:yes gene_type:complete